MKLYTHALIDLTMIPAGVIALSYTSSEVITIIAAVSGLATVVGGLIVNIIQTAKARREISVVSTKTDAIDIKAETIGAKVDGTATKANARIEALENELRLMREVAAEKKETAALLAQAATPAAGPASLTQQIEKNTKDTATNTGRTDG